MSATFAIAAIATATTARASSARSAFRPASAHENRNATRHCPLPRSTKPANSQPPEDNANVHCHESLQGRQGRGGRLRDGLVLAQDPPRRDERLHRLPFAQG